MCKLCPPLLLTVHLLLSGYYPSLCFLCHHNPLIFRDNIWPYTRDQSCPSRPLYVLGEPCTCPSQCPLLYLFNCLINQYCSPYLDLKSGTTSVLRSHHIPIPTMVPGTACHLGVPCSWVTVCGDKRLWVAACITMLRIWFLIARLRAASFLSNYMWITSEPLHFTSPLTCSALPDIIHKIRITFFSLFLVLPAQP